MTYPDANGEAVAADIAALRAECPGWSFTSTWATAGTGPDRRVLLATRGPAVVSAFDAGGMRERLRDLDGRA